MPDVAWTCGDRCSWELENRSTYDFDLHRPVVPALSKMLRRAYISSMAFMDSEIGRVLDELERLELVNSTLVILHGERIFSLIFL